MSAAEKVAELLDRHDLSLTDIEIREELDKELAKLNLNLRTVRSRSRMVSTTAFEAGNAAGALLAINPGIGAGQATRNIGRG